MVLRAHASICLHVARGWQSAIQFTSRRRRSALPPPLPISFMPYNAHTCTHSIMPHFPSTGCQSSVMSWVRGSSALKHDTPTGSHALGGVSGAGSRAGLLCDHALGSLPVVAAAPTDRHAQAILVGLYRKCIGKWSESRTRGHGRQCSRISVSG